MNIRLNVTCPYCGYTNKTDKKIDSFVSAPVVLLCDSEGGGCDRHFVFSVNVNTVLTVRAIDGEKA